jgi:hypothetical protein
VAPGIFNVCMHVLRYLFFFLHYILIWHSLLEVEGLWTFLDYNAGLFILYWTLQQCRVFVPNILEAIVTVIEVISICSIEFFQFFGIFFSS